MAHPRLFITDDETEHTRSVDEVRQAIRGDEVPGLLWEQLRSQTEADCDTAPILPDTAFPGRTTESTVKGIVDWTVTHRACQRIKRAALACLLTGEHRFRDVALEQIEALFDHDRWPEWQDRHHITQMGLPADLRTGTIVRDVAIAYDWLFPHLSADRRAWIVDGLDQRGIGPYFEALAADAWWADAMNNWTTVIVGGMGIAGMALEHDHPRANELIDVSLPRMEAYLDVYGPDGEFNESVGYAASTQLPVMYFSAHQSMTGGDNRLASHPFPAACRWLMYATLPPGRYAAFGDTPTDRPPTTGFFPAVATAARDPTLQWYYTVYADRSETRQLPLELLWFDDSLSATQPDGVLPRGQAFEAHGGLISSRTDWDPDTTPSIAYAKAGIEDNHQHRDAGQVCLDGYGERLLRDLGPPSKYPADFFGENRDEYYNAASWGHNVVTFDEEGPTVPAGTPGKIIRAEFDDSTGGVWQFDLTHLYEQTEHLIRTVVHLQPHVAVVHDEAALARPATATLRWHTATAASPNDDGTFSVRGKEAGLEGVVTRLDDGSVSFAAGRHAYRKPYHRDRDGAPLAQRHEPFVSVTLPETMACRLLSMFSIIPPDSSGSPWVAREHSWRNESDSEAIDVRIDDGDLVVASEDGRSWRVSI